MLDRLLAAGTANGSVNPAWDPITSLLAYALDIHKKKQRGIEGERKLTTMYPYTPITLGLDDADLGLRLELEKERSWILGWIISAND